MQKRTLKSELITHIKTTSTVSVGTGFLAGPRLYLSTSIVLFLFKYIYAHKYASRSNIMDVYKYASRSNIMDAYKYASRSNIRDAYKYASRSNIMDVYKYASRSNIMDAYKYASRTVGNRMVPAICEDCIQSNCHPPLPIPKKGLQ